MKNPNGFGSVTKLSGKRRKPYMVRITNGWELLDANTENERHQQKRSILGYYEKRDQAIVALAAYNANPYNIETSIITFAEVFEKWKAQKYDTISKSNQNGYNAAFETSRALHNTKFVDIKADHMQDVIKKCGKNYDTLRKIKVLYGQLFKYAMKNDIVSKDYSEFVDLGKNDNKSTRMPFTDAEIKRLFNVIDSIDMVDTVLIMIYTGFRIGELLTIESKNVDINNRTIIGGIKTEAGIDRIVPINSKILEMIKKRLAEGHETLIARSNGKPYKYDNYYRENFKPLMDQLGMKHKPHDARHTFATLMSNAGADTIALQKIIGHSSYEITANLYTHKDIEQLTKAIDLI